MVRHLGRVVAALLLSLSSLSALAPAARAQSPASSQRGQSASDSLRGQSTSDSQRAETASDSLRVQSASDSLRAERLAALGKLWGAIKYFHPALASRPIDWDSALVTAIPTVRAARTPAEYAAAIDEMLSVLGDPATRVVRRAAPVKAAASAPVATRWAEDSALVLTIGDATDVNGVMQGLAGATSDLARAPRVIFDLRAHGVEREAGYLDFIFANAGANALLATTPVVAPGTRSRMYSGFPTQAGGTSGGYWSGFSVHAGSVISPRPGNAGQKRIGFVIDELSDVPPIALALQQAGLAVIAAEGMAEIPSRQNIWTTTLPDSVEVTVRVAEPILADGRTILKPDTVVAPAADADRALNAALALVRAPARARPAPAPGEVFTPPPERAYAEVHFPSLPYRLLGAFRFWNAIDYFYPYKSLMGEDWNRALVAAVPDFEAAGDSVGYALAVARLVHRIHDSHGFIRSSVLRAYLGEVSPPLKVRYIEGRPVVTEVSTDSSVRASGLRVGDIVEKIDGQPVAARRARLEPLLASSTPQALDRQVAGYLLSGPEGSTAELVVRGADQREREVRLTRRAAALTAMRWTRPGPAWKVLPGNIGYVDLERLTVPQVDSMFDALWNTKAIIFDNRSYPQGTAWSIAPRLTDQRGAGAARFQRPVVMSPDTTERTTYAFVQTLPPTDKPRYHKPTVMLVDERTISQAEHTGLFFEAANRTRFVGSPTMGANGDVTAVVLPGGITASFTGHDVRHADGRQLQRVGLQPDVLVRPTIAGIRAGRDEVLERAVRYIEQGR